jgi:hypothetical protein
MHALQECGAPELLPLHHQLPAFLVPGNAARGERVLAVDDERLATFPAAHAMGSFETKVAENLFPDLLGAGV